MYTHNLFEMNKLLSGKTEFEILLKEYAAMLDPIIVTALGIEKKEFSLSYSAMQLKSDEFNRIKDPNMITVLAGKAAGVQISKSSSGPGASAKVSIRGIRSVASDNQPLLCNRWCPNVEFYFRTSLFDHWRYGQCR